MLIWRRAHFRSPFPPENLRSTWTKSVGTGQDRIVAVANERFQTSIGILDDCRLTLAGPQKRSIAVMHIRGLAAEHTGSEVRA